MPNHPSGKKKNIILFGFDVTKNFKIPTGVGPGVHVNKI